MSNKFPVTNDPKVAAQLLWRGYGVGLTDIAEYEASLAGAKLKLFKRVFGGSRQFMNARTSFVIAKTIVEDLGS